MEKEFLLDVHRSFLERAVRVLSETPGISGVAVGGSYLSKTMDEFSDLDLIINVDSADYERVLGERGAIAGTLGKLLGAFTGEHVGEPRLLICLYDDPLLHVDLKFVKDVDFSHRVEAPAVLWERDDSISDALKVGVAKYPAPDAQWIEDRFWIWVHYGASKIGRGELFEALDFLAFLRSHVLGPLALHQAGLRATGVRRIEALLPDFSVRLESTIARHDSEDCCRALGACIEVYRYLRKGCFEVKFQTETENAAAEYLAGVSRFKK